MILSKESRTILTKYRQVQDYYQVLCKSHDSDMLSVLDLLEETRKKLEDTERQLEVALNECKSLKSVLPEHVPNNRSMKRSLSEPKILEEKVAGGRQELHHTIGSVSNVNMHSPLIALKNSWTRGRQLMECIHSFAQTRAFFLGSCNVCLKGWGIDFGLKTFKCRDCGLLVHERCRETAPLPCIPFVSTPQKQTQVRPRLVDFCPSTRPQIPPIIIRCVVALEGIYLDKEGLYRIGGSDSEVEKLMNAFSSKFVPNLSTRGPELITGCIKKFLGHLREALIPYTSYTEFIRASEIEGDDHLISLINGLPIPNLDTLAFLCAHLQKVASNAAYNKMPVENLAIVLGPTIVGPIRRTAMKAVYPIAGADIKEAEEVRRQVHVLDRLLKLNYWSR